MPGGRIQSRANPFHDRGRGATTERRTPTFFRFLTEMSQGRPLRLLRLACRAGTIAARASCSVATPWLIAYVRLSHATSSRFALRFSLRVLLIAFTAFAIGFPVWYRWPYEESQDETIPRPADPFAAPATGRPPAIKSTLVTTWQRQWGGGRLKHGPESTYRNGNLILRVTYRSGILHGPYETRQRNGFREVGQYVEGRKSGEWRLLDPQGNLRRSSQWRDDRLDGAYLIVEVSGRSRHLLFAKGRLITADGHEVEDRLGELLASNAIDNPQIVDALTSQTDIHFIETPLKDAAAFIAERHEFPVLIDPHHVDPKTAISADWEGVQLSSVLSIIATEHGLACDYRYGLVWITSAADAQNWKDLTGMADIVPPKGSQLARSWNDVGVDVGAINQPLADVIEQQLVPRLAIAVDVSQIRSNDKKEPTYLVTGSFKGFPFKHALGILLDQARCRCKLEGETLVILPPE